MACSYIDIGSDVLKSQRTDNNTRMKESRGHKPDDLVRKEFDGIIPAIVPRSSHAAEMYNATPLFDWGKYYE